MVSTISLFGVLLPVINAINIFANLQTTAIISGSIALVDTNNSSIGFGEKHDAHARGLLYRAFSIFVFNHANELILHQRAHEKYHSPELWTNTCCSHLPHGMEMNEAI